MPDIAATNKAIVGEGSNESIAALKTEECDEKVILNAKRPTLGVSLFGFEGAKRSLKNSRSAIVEGVFMREKQKFTTKMSWGKAKYKCVLLHALPAAWPVF